MIVPAAMFIDIASEMLKKRDPKFIADESKELHEFGEQRLSDIADTFGIGNYEKILAGYLLGLETARALLSMNPNAVSKKINV